MPGPVHPQRAGGRLPRDARLTARWRWSWSGPPTWAGSPSPSPTSSRTAGGPAGRADPRRARRRCGGETSSGRSTSARRWCSSSPTRGSSPAAGRRRPRPDGAGPVAAKLKVGVVSDTHGLVRPEAVEALRGSDVILHAGDVGGSHVLQELGELAPVDRGARQRGRRWARLLPDRRRLDLGGVAVLLLHDRRRSGPNPADEGTRGRRLRPLAPAPGRDEAGRALVQSGQRRAQALSAAGFGRAAPDRGRARAPPADRARGLTPGERAPFRFWRTIGHHDQGQGGPAPAAAPRRNTWVRSCGR